MRETASVFVCATGSAKIVGGRAVDHQAASTSQMGRFETEVLTTPENLAALADMRWRWIDRAQAERPPKWITLDVDSSVSPPNGAQEGAAWNGHFNCSRYDPLLVFSQFGHLEHCKQRSGNVRSADGWEEALKPVMARYPDKNVLRLFRGDAAFAIPALYETLEAAGYHSDIRLPTNAVLQEGIANLLKRLVSRPPNYVRRERWSERVCRPLHHYRTSGITMRQRPHGRPTLSWRCHSVCRRPGGFLPSIRQGLLGECRLQWRLRMIRHHFRKRTDCEITTRRSSPLCLKVYLVPKDLFHSRPLII